MKKENNKTEKKETKQIEKLRGIGWRMAMFPAAIVYFEFCFHRQIYGNIDKTIIYPCIFGLLFGMIIAMLTCIFKRIGNAVIGYTMVVIIAFLHIAQAAYYKIFGTFFSFSSISGAHDAMDFVDEVYDALEQNLFFEIQIGVVLFAFALLGIVALSFERPAKKGNIVAGVVTVACIIATVVSLNFGGRNDFSNYSLFHGAFIPELSMNRFGVEVTMGRDITTSLFGSKNKDGKGFNEAYITMEDVNEKGYEPQIDASIDLKELYDGTNDSDLKDITAYISNKEPTYKNEYTGMYEGYNLIFITAESLSPYVIREDWTPTLYKMMHEGFVFENYYNPTWYKSTIDGEFVNCLSQYPSTTGWSMNDSASTYQPYAPGNALNKLGYTSKAYHDYDYTFYDRSETHPNMGYDFKAIGNGLELPSQDSFCSDLEMMQTVYDDMTAKEPFNAYFMTYSGHLPYSYKDNPIVQKNWDKMEELTEGLSYNETVKSYIAAQLELEYALEYLVDRLEQDGKLDHTLFVISPDHFPYVMRTGDYDILAQQDVSSTVCKNYHSCLGIWNSQMKEPVVVDKICASVDILPTVLNLMGVEYDSRLLAGRDILYEEDGYAVFMDYSYITPYVSYNSATGEITQYEQTKNDKDTELVNADKISQMYYYSKRMIDMDYYRYVYGKEK